MKKYIISVVGLFFIINVNGMESVNLSKKNSDLCDVVVDSVLGEEPVSGHNFFTISSGQTSANKLEPKNLTEMRQLVRERSQRKELHERKRSDPHSDSGVMEHSQGAVVESASDSALTSSRKSAPRRMKNFISPRRPNEELKNSRGEAKVIPRTMSEVQSVVRKHSVRSEPISRQPRKLVPGFSREQLEYVHQNSRQSKKLYTEDDVYRMLEVQKVRQSKVLYTEDEVEAILRQASYDVSSLISSRFRDYGHQYNVPLQELPQYARLLDEISISPRILVEFMYQKHGEGHPKDYEIERYKRMSKEKPIKYENLVFGLLKEIVEGNGSDEGMSSQMPREFVDTHVGLLHDEIGSQSDDIFQYRVAVVIKFLALVGTTIWAIYAQVSHGTAAGPCYNITG